MKKYSKKTIIRTDLINKSGECPIAIRYIYDRKTFLYPIGLTIKPDARAYYLEESIRFVEKN